MKTKKNSQPKKQKKKI